MESIDRTNIAREVIEQADDRVRDTVRALMGAKRYSIARLAPLLDMNPETLRRKLNSFGSQRAFSGGEVARLAEIFMTPIPVFFDGLGLLTHAGPRPDWMGPDRTWDFPRPPGESTPGYDFDSGLVWRDAA